MQSFMSVACSIAGICLLLPSFGHGSIDLADQEYIYMYVYTLFGLPRFLPSVTYIYT